MLKALNFFLAMYFRKLFCIFSLGRVGHGINQDALADDLLFNTLRVIYLSYGDAADVREAALLLSELNDVPLVDV